jgi:hypothetical protein
MPGGNRTGPMGQGPKTGRGAGYCGDRDEAGFTTAPGKGGFFGGRGGGAGRGRGRGFGAGRGQGRMGSGGWFGAQSPDMGTEELQTNTEAGRLKAQINALEARLARLEKED